MNTVVQRRPARCSAKGSIRYAKPGARHDLACGYPISYLTLTARADALFASNLSAWSRPTVDEVAAAISDALMSFGGAHGCACEVAAAYGEHPETAAPRMRWALQLTETMKSDA
jgi:hypothetical protein